MDTQLLAKEFEKSLKDCRITWFEKPEIYYFALGRILNWTFAELGGIDMHRNEFNFLTNPYLPADIQTLSIRMIRFLKKIRSSSKLHNKELLTAINCLLSEEKNPFYVKESNRNLESAFYAGLYWEN